MPSPFCSHEPGQDERVLFAEITEEGMALRDKAVEVPSKMGGCISLTKEDILELYRLLHKILADIV